MRLFICLFIYLFILFVVQGSLIKSAPANIGELQQYNQQNGVSPTIKI